VSLLIPPYLQSHLEVADTLPIQLHDVPEAVVQNIQDRLRKLVQLVAVRDRELYLLQADEEVTYQRAVKAEAILAMSKSVKDVEEVK
jgi:biopolymer transport protein ExbD